MTNWNKIVDGGGTGVTERALSVSIDSMDNIYVAGTKHNGTDYDWWIKKFDSNGNEDTSSWNKTYDGGNGNDVAYSVTVIK